MSNCTAGSGSVHDYSLKTLDGKSLSLKTYASGKLLLVVNVASFWGFTKINYQELNALTQDYSPHLQILGIPCNQFDLQEPGSDGEILNGLKYVRPGNGFTPNFTLTTKSDVNGQDKIQLYRFMKNRCPATSDVIAQTSLIFWSPVATSDVTWNFEKFLIDASGQPRYRFNPSFMPNALRPYIDKMIKEMSSEKQNVIHQQQDLIKLTQL